MPDPTPPADPPEGVAEELDIDDSALAQSSVSLVVSGDRRSPRVELLIERADGRAVRPVPARFLLDEGRRIDLAGLVGWLGLPADAVDDLEGSLVPERRPVDEEGEGGEWELREADEGEPLWLGPYADHEPPVPLLLPAPEAGATVSTDGSPQIPRPELGDTDAWPEDVAGWLAVIDNLRDQYQGKGTLRAGDVRALYGGHDDEVLEFEPGVGPVDEDGNPVDPHDDGSSAGDSSWDPSTDPLDPALEEALRIRGVPGARPAPEEPPSTAAAAAAAAAAGEAEDLPTFQVDNRVAILAEPEPSSAGCLRFLVNRWVIVGGLGVVVVLAVILLVLQGGDGDGSDSSSGGDAAATETDEPAATAEEILRQATQDLLDARTAEVEQDLLIANASGESTVSATGAVDFENSDAQLALQSNGSMFDAYLTDTTYAFDNGTGWVETEPGALNDDEQIAQLQLGYLGIGEAMNPLAIAYIADAAEDVTEAGDGTYHGTTVLPVLGPGAVHVDHWSRSVYGRGQDELAGLGITLRFRPGIDDGPTITLVSELEDVIPFLGDDPLADDLRGITLSNEAYYGELGEQLGLQARDAQARDLQAFLRQFF